LDYDRTNIPAAYDRARDHGPEFLELWMKVVGSQVDTNTTRAILDLGCGTGRFAQGLADKFNADVVGIDPSIKMLREALNKPDRKRVFYAAGNAEALPLLEDSVDMVFISMVFHHFPNPATAAAECRRVLRKSGRLCLRTATSERISDYPYVPFFPGSVRLLEERLPTLAKQRETFETAGFQTVSTQLVIQEIAANLFAYADKLALKGDSILASLSDKEFHDGLHELRSAAAALPSRPVVEPIDFLVFAK
jgi:SAM-dependent methyltransferase